jgi:hypothetical protein
MRRIALQAMSLRLNLDEGWTGINATIFPAWKLLIADGS